MCTYVGLALAVVNKKSRLKALHITNEFMGSTSELHARYTENKDGGSRAWNQ